MIALGRFKILVFLFVLLEITALIVIGDLLGVLGTLLWIVLTFFIGLSVLRREGSYYIHLMMRAQPHLSSEIEMSEGALRFTGGVLLLLPGFITDGFGFLLLIPYVRRALMKRLSTHESNQANTDKKSSRVIEGEYRRRR